MAIKLTYPNVLFSIALIMLVACWCCPAAAYQLEVTAWIDGHCQLIIQGDTVQWHNITWNVPGYEDPYDPYDDPPGVPEPTYLTTTHMGTLEWQPTWPAETKHDEEDNDVFSSLFSDLNLPIAAMAQTVGLSVDAGRNSVSILENPSASNGYALIVDFNDYEGGADLYTVQLNYTPVPLPPSALLLGSGLLGLLAVRGRCRGHRD